MAIHDPKREAPARASKAKSRRGDMNARTLARIHAAATIARLRQEALYDRLADRFRSAIADFTDPDAKSLSAAAERAREHLTTAGVVTEVQGQRLKGFLVRDADRLADEPHTNVAVAYRTGEVTSVGTLTCVRCHAQLRLPRTVTVPPCPKCSATEFRKSL